MAIKHLLVVSDLHCGSFYSLAPPNFRLADGSRLSQTPVRRAIWKAWRDFSSWAGRIIGSDDYALLVNGDAVEGAHHDCKEIWSTDPSVHLRCALECLSPVAQPAKRVLVVRGTQTHTHELECDLGEYLGAERDPNTGNPCSDHWRFHINGLLHSAAHHTCTAKWPWTKSGAAAKAIFAERAEAQKVGAEPPSVFLRAHRHQWMAYQEEAGTLIITPSWQLLTRYGHRVVVGARPVVGGCLLSYGSKGEPPWPRMRTYSVPDFSPTVQLD